MPKFLLSAAALAAALMALPAAAGESAASQAVDATGAGRAAHAMTPWWDALGDPVLAGLIRDGIGSNLDIAQAHARLGRSRALLLGARATRGPAGGLALQARGAQASEHEAPGLARAARRSDQVQLGLDLSWEVDLFGRIAAQVEAADQRVAATEAQVRGVQLAVSSEIADAYFALLGAREQLALARTVAANRERTLALVQTRSRGGVAAPIDEMRAAGELDAALADIPPHEAALRIATHRLAVLTGRSPGGFEVGAPAALAPRAVALAVPDAAAWLAQRPDVQEHEARLRANALDVAAVRAEFFPRLTISGVLGFVAGSVTGLGSASSVSWLGAPSLLAPLLDRPRIEARLAAASADQQAALAAYRQRVLLATEEVENALARYAAGRQQFDSLQRRAQHAGAAERLARVRYEAGAADLLELLDAQRSAQQAQAQLAGSLAQQYQHLVAVFKASGGGVAVVSAPPAAGA